MALGEQMIWEEVKKTVSISRNFKLAGDVLVSILETELAFACVFPLIRLPLDRKPKFFFFHASPALLLCFTSSIKGLPLQKLCAYYYPSTSLQSLPMSLPR